MARSKHINFNDIPAVAKALRKLAKQSILIGITGDGANDSDIAIYASANEFGTDDGRIPERSFLRSTMNDKNKNKKIINKTIARVYDRKGKPEKIPEVIGEKYRDAVIKKILSNIPPKNADKTIDRKKSSRTLVDTGLMRKAIDYKIVRS